jgi:hypothetical protein
LRRAPTALVITFAFVLLAAGCEGGNPEPAESPEPTDTPTPTGTPTPVAEEGYPLTGEPVEDEDVLERPILAVKVDNHPRARPQAGLARADVVMVEPVEGTTRFVALFHSRQADRVGPVRSGRFVDGELLPSLQPAFAISGAAEVVLADLRERRLELYGEGQTDAWTRDTNRRSPHNLFLATEPLFEGAAEDGAPAATQPWPYDDAVNELDLERGREVEGAELDYPDRESVGWEWDGDRFVRSQDGSAHEAEGSGRVGARNVLILRVPATGDRTRPIDPIGSGELVLLRDGREFTGTWEKEGDTAHFRWLDEAGDPLRLAVGRTWIELMPDTGSVSVRPAAAAGAEGDDAEGDDADGGQ